MKKRANAKGISSISTAFISFVFFCGSANADVLFEQLPTDGADAVLANAGAGAQNADEFTLLGSSLLQKITFWGSYDAVDADSFVIRVLRDRTGVPAAGNGYVAEYFPATVTKSSTALRDVAKNDIFQFDFQLSIPVALDIGRYYLSVSNETQLAGWYWSTLLPASGDAWARSADGDQWAVRSVAPGNLTFRIEGIPTAVPVPGVAGLLGIAQCALMIFARRKRQSKALTHS